MIQQATSEPRGGREGKPGREGGIMGRSQDGGMNMKSKELTRMVKIVSSLVVITN